jgi:murein DD-endopeptidase MepM/ murein hydrolase activator NlpD
MTLEHDVVELQDRHASCVVGAMPATELRRRGIVRIMLSAVRWCLVVIVTSIVFAAPHLTVAAGTVPTTEPSTSGDEAADAVAEISAARDRANAAAEAYLAAESKLDLLELDRQRLEQDVARLEREVSELQLAVEQVAINRFVASGSKGIPVLTGLSQPSEQLQADVLAQVVSESGATTIDDFDAARDRLDDKRRQLNDTEAALEQSKADLLDLQADAEAEVERLREIESQRLENEAVAVALAAQQREEARQLAEIERRQAEAARESAPAAGVGVTSAITAKSTQGNTTGNIGASGGDTGGRTGGGGIGSNPRAAGDGFVDGTIVCPVMGGSAYGDTWGAPRSGGRRHQGTDMLAPSGTPLVAVYAGVVNQVQNALGGTSLQLFADNGNRYYYAHLSAYEGPSGIWVPQGQVVGYIGDSGNATGIPHLHFEIHPGGGIPVNPYLSMRAAGC